MEADDDEINVGPWTATDEDDLRDASSIGASLDEVAKFLCRDAADVAERAWARLASSGSKEDSIELRPVIDSRRRRSPLFLRTRTSERAKSISGKCHTRTHALYLKERPPFRRPLQLSLSISVMRRRTTSCVATIYAFYQLK